MYSALSLQQEKHSLTFLTSKFPLAIVSFPESQQEIRINPGLHAVIQQSYLIAPNTMLKPTQTEVNRNIMKNFAINQSST